jgi:hypothetical protein
VAEEDPSQDLSSLMKEMAVAGVGDVPLVFYFVRGYTKMTRNFRTFRLRLHLRENPGLEFDVTGREE